MRNFVVVAVVLCVLGAVPALADDGAVLQPTLNQIGLGGLQVMSDAEGMQVRGMSASAEATSLSLFSLILADPETGNQFVQVGTDFARATDENVGLNEEASAEASSAVNLAAFDIEWSVNTVQTFAAILVTPGAGVGGGAMAQSPAINLFFPPVP
jgi:hypothetical protein